MPKKGILSLVWLGMFLLTLAGLAPNQAWANKCGVNVGPYYGQVDQVKGLTKAGGWVVALGTLGDCGGYGSLFGRGLNVILRAYNAGQPFDAAQALAWTATLGKLDTKGQVVYFVPWNEPNQGGGEGGHPTDPSAVIDYLNALRTNLSEAGLLDTKVVLLSPMLNKTHPDFSTYLNNGGTTIYNLAQGSSINEYDFKQEGASAYTDACLHTDPFKDNCKYAQIGIPTDKPFYAPEAGVGGTVAGSPGYKDGEISIMLRNSWSKIWSGDNNFSMFAVFSYDPHRDEVGQEWRKEWDIFRAPQTRQFYANTCSSGDVRPINGFDTDRFEHWLTSKRDQLVECGECGFAPKERPGLCSGVGKDLPTLDLSAYDDYNADDEVFYIHPLAGLSPNRNVEVLRNDLLKQGYEARCATPGFKIGMDLEGQNFLAAFIDQVNEGYHGGEGTGFGNKPYSRLPYDAPPRDLPFRSILGVDLREVLTPVFRNVSGKRFLTTSLEEFFGFKDVLIKKETTAEIRSAPINSLLTNSQRCQQSIKILLAQEAMCNKLDAPLSCPLYPRPISSTNFTIFSLLERVYWLASHPHESIGNTNLSDLHDDNTSRIICETLMQKDWDAEAKEALLATPLTIDRAYRLGFLVTSIKMKMNPINQGTLFSLFTHPNAGFQADGPNNPKHLVLVNAFKIPDILTNNNQADTGSARTSWNDPSLLSVQSLTTKSQQEKKTEDKAEYQSALKTAADRYQTGTQHDGSEIFCTTGAGAVGVGAGSCIDELPKALVDIINATADLNRQGDDRFAYFEPNCPELKQEPANIVLDNGSLGTTENIYKTDVNPGVLFNTDFGGQLFRKLFNIPDEDVTEVDDDIDETHQVEPREKSNPSFAETWREGDPQIRNAVWQDLVKDWGLKTVFYVSKKMKEIGFPYNRCCDDVEVRFYLVYPVGYDQETVQTVLAGSFLSTEQIIQLAETEAEFDRIQLSGEEVNFEGASMGREFDNYLEECEHVVYDARGRPIDTEMRPPCRRSFGFSIVQRGQALAAGLLGGKLGFWLREVQQSLHSKTSFAHTYLASCKTTEQFLLGRCGQEVEPVPTPEPDLECEGAMCGLNPGSSGPPAAIPPPGGPTCSDPTKEALDVELIINTENQWKVSIRCNSCTGTWGDMEVQAWVQGVRYHWVPGNLTYPYGHFELPSCARGTCDPGYGQEVPPGFHGEFCATIQIKSNPAGNQCQSQDFFTRCVTVN